MAGRHKCDRDSGINDPGNETLDNPDRLDTIDEDSVRSDEEPEDNDNEDNNEPEDSPLHTPPEDVPEPDKMANPAPAPAVAGGVLQDNCLLFPSSMANGGSIRQLARGHQKRIADVQLE